MALTPQIIAPGQEDGDTALERVYEPRKKQIWLAVGVAFLGAVAFVGIRESRRSRLDGAWERYHRAASKFELNPMAPANDAAAREQITELKALIAEGADEKLAPFALERIAKAHIGLREYDDAVRVLEDIQVRFKDYESNRISANPAANSSKTLIQNLIDSVKSEKQWQERHTYVHHWPSEDRLALIETNAGSFWIGFYDKDGEAKQHVESFIRNAKKGAYNGTQIYSIVTTTDGAPEKFELGSRASGLADAGGVMNPALHDADEPTDTIEPEEARSTIRHVYRVISAAKMPSGESATRFQVVNRTTGIEKLNGETTPFAAVMDREQSLKVIDRIGHASTYVNHPDTKDSPNSYKMKDHPFPNILIRRISVWSREKLEEGHAWDTKRVGTDEQEPWEAARGRGPLPDEFK